jgi:hypothetical protein
MLQSEGHTEIKQIASSVVGGVVMCTVYAYPIGREIEFLAPVLRSPHRVGASGSSPMTQVSRFLENLKNSRREI